MKFSWFLGLIVVSALLASCSSGKKPGASFSTQPVIKNVDDTAQVAETMRTADFKTVDISNASNIEIVLCPDSVCKLRKLSDRSYRVVAPSLEAIKVNGCGKLHVSGKNPKCSHFVLDLQKVNVAMIDPLLSADQVDAKIDNCMFTHFRVNCTKMQFSAHSIGHVKVFGHAKSVTWDVDNMKQIDAKSLGH